MILIVDSREQTPLKFPDNIEVEVSGLYSGDYSVKGLEHLFSVERKSLSDLCGSLTSGRERFEKELHRLRGYRFKRLLIVGDRRDLETGNYRSKATPKSLLASLNAFEVRYEIPTVFADEKLAAELVVRWGFWFAREVRIDAEKLAKNDDRCVSAGLKP